MTKSDGAGTPSEKGGAEVASKSSGTTAVTYLGHAAVRKISKADLKALDENYDGGALEFNRENMFTVEVQSSEAVLEMLKGDGDFRVGGDPFTSREARHLQDKVVLADSERPAVIAPEGPQRVSGYVSQGAGGAVGGSTGSG